MRKIGLALAALSLMAPATALASPAERSDEPQWIYRDPTGAQEPVAAFLDWTYQSVLLHVSCDGEDLVFQFRLGGAPDDGEALALLIDDTEISMITARETDAHGAVLRGRMPASSGLLDRLERAQHIMISAPSEMGEPWHLGRARPLVQVASECAAG